MEDMMKKAKKKVVKAKRVNWKAYALGLEKDIDGLEFDLASAQSKLVQAQQDLAKARADYQFVVNRAADQKLDGYRELGARAADAENELDSLRRGMRAYPEAPSTRYTREVF